MKREPSIHIFKSRLVEILEDILSEDEDVKGLVNDIFYRAKPYSISSRTVTTSNDRIEKKIKRVTNTTRLDSDIFSQLIYAKRKSLKHRGISMIKSGSKDWDILKEVTGQALLFCEDFELSIREGFIKYIEIGLSKMSKYGLNKFLGMYQGISETHQALIDISEDEDPGGTKKMYEYYTKIIADKTGVFERLEELPEKYVWFIKARNQADDLKVPHNVYIKAQFEALNFAKGIPYPSQMVGPKATERVNRYAFSKGIKSNKVGISKSDQLKEIFGTQ